MHTLPGCPRRLLLAAAALALVAGPLRADDGPPTARLNRKVDDVAFTDAAGKRFALADHQGKQAVVVVFLSFECPVSTSYAGPLAELARSYADRGVAFLAVSAGEDEDAAGAARHAGEYRLPFPVFADPDGRAAEAFKAETTPEAFLLDRHLVLRYRGRIDNAYSARLRRNPVTTRQDLRAALDEVLAGKEVTEPATRSVGCPLRREAPAARATGPVTYYRDVVPVLQDNCQGCHRAGEVGPFSLMTYRQAVNWAGDLKEYTQSRKMPPWKPAEGLPFHNERRLSDRDIATVAAWVDGGTPAGDPKDAPPPRQFTEGWQLGRPDLVLTPDDDFRLAASGRDAFRCFVVPTNFTEDRYVTAMQFRPGNPRVVHHSLLFVDGTGQGRKLLQKEKDRAKGPDEVDGGAGYPVGMGIGFTPQGGLGGWAPGQMARRLPDDTGYFLPKGADVIIQVHYHRNGRAEQDRPQLGLYFAPKPVGHRYQGMVIAGRSSGKPLLSIAPNFFIIPRGAEHYALHGGIVVEADCLLHSVMPHMHLLGKEIRVTLTPPDGPKVTLVAIKDWDYNWQETYVFKEALPVKAGTVIEVDAVYDNSAANPNNPSDPPQAVTFGEQTTNEMCFVFLGATSNTPGRIRFKAQEPKAE
jgi:peroxiredoxin/mono/diheme cytochrome c family protein